MGISGKSNLAYILVESKVTLVANSKGLLFVCTVNSLRACLGNQYIRMWAQLHHVHMQMQLCVDRFGKGGGFGVPHGRLGCWLGSKFVPSGGSETTCVANPLGSYLYIGMPYGLCIPCLKNLCFVHMDEGIHMRI